MDAAAVSDASIALPEAPPDGVPAAPGVTTITTITGTGIPPAVEITLPPLPPAPQGRIPAERRASSAELKGARWLLTCYDTFRHQLADIQGDALEGGYGVAYDTQQGRGSGPANPTMHRALRLVDRGELAALERRVRAVAYTLDELPDTLRRLVKLRYQQRRQWPEIGKALGMGSRTAQLWDARICTRIVERLRRPVVLALAD